ncbi:hypothetical protein H9X85_11875 [Anaerotignum lactatifermentans]|uniref:Arylsulfotransferase N-terminal domain-containing protein n=1 Tax=Anaerotignum lactatifermentans TaxID=160404 RepID=A0ABS2GDA6_9FIRM|nr:hypothetical protein [Anaerotignum lactatifermentans]MBM6830327.1 hypothetical protein [Anaerotignum lactatifermentans]MBM6878852.1 hypothetical protein [Anaerotignum lactatifermentans]MBM6951888.1 hypothetical protein [Anaerotignum lactatifermentans]
MKKRWSLLPAALLACSLLAVGLSVFAVNQNKWDGRIELTDAEGDRRALDAFVLRGTVGDSVHKIDFTLEDGEVRKESFSLESGVPVFYSLIVPDVPWGKDTLEVWDNSAEIQPAPGTKIETTDTVEESKLGDRMFSEDYYDDNGRLRGTTTTFDTGQVSVSFGYACMKNKENGGTSESLKYWGYAFPTNMTYTPEEPLELIRLQGEEEWDYYEVRNYTDAPIRTLGAWSESRQSYYITLSTDAYCDGSVGLYCVGPESEEIGKTYQREEHDAPLETLTEIPVSADRRILWLEDAGDGLLLILGEGDGITMELYDYEGRLLDRSHSATEESVDEMEVQKTEWPHGKGFFLTGSQRIEQDAYYVHYFEGIWVEDGTIISVYRPQTSDGGMTAVGRNVVLTASKGRGKDDFVYDNLDKELSYYDITVLDVSENPEGDCIYAGRLETDIFQDRFSVFANLAVAESEMALENQIIYRNEDDVEVQRRALWLLETEGKGV